MKLPAKSDLCHSRLSRCLKWNGQTKVAAEEKRNSSVISSWTPEQLNLDKSVEFWRKLVLDWVSPCSFLDLIVVYLLGWTLWISRPITVWSPVNQPTNKPPAVNTKPQVLSCVVSMLCSRSTLSKYIWTHQWVRHTLALNTALHYEEYRHRQVSPFKLRLCPWELYTTSKSNHISSAEHKV